MKAPQINDLIAIAKKAGDIVRAGYLSTNEISMKGEIDLVTETDKKTEEYILSEIKTRFPSHSIIAEESENGKISKENIWIIDPIDGTTNFAHKLPIFCISIAYMKNNKIQLGVIYDPMRDEMFSAERGEGAFLNGEKINVSSETQLKKSVLVTGFPYDRFQNPDNNLENFSKLALKVRGIRRLGSAALDLCNVAAGRVDGYWEIRLEVWDIAAGSLIAEEAGAKITNRYGDNNIFEAPFSIVAANEVLHQKISEIINA